MRKILFRGKRIDNGEWVDVMLDDCCSRGGQGCQGLPNEEIERLLADRETEKGR